MANRSVRIDVNDALEHAFIELTHLLRTWVIPFPQEETRGKAIGEVMYNFLCKAAIQAMHDDFIVKQLPGDAERFAYLVDKYYTPTQQPTSLSMHIMIAEENLAMVESLGEYLNQFDLPAALQHRGHWKRTLIINVAVGWLYETFDQRLDRWYTGR